MDEWIVYLIYENNDDKYDSNCYNVLFVVLVLNVGIN